MEIGGGGEEGGGDGGQREGQQRRDDVDNVRNTEQKQQPKELRQRNQCTFRFFIFIRLQIEDAKLCITCTKQSKKYTICLKSLSKTFWNLNF